jgi:hypothetical protein
MITQVAQPNGRVEQSSNEYDMCGDGRNTGRADLLLSSGQSLTNQHSLTVRNGFDDRSEAFKSVGSRRISVGSRKGGDRRPRRLLSQPLRANLASRLRASSAWVCLQSTSYDVATTLLVEVKSRLPPVIE